MGWSGTYLIYLSLHCPIIQLWGCFLKKTIKILLKKNFVETDMGSDHTDRLRTLWKPQCNSIVFPSSTRCRSVGLTESDENYCFIQTQWDTISWTGTVLVAYWLRCHITAISADLSSCFLLSLNCCCPLNNWNAPETQRLFDPLMWRVNVNKNKECQTVLLPNVWSKYKVSFMITYVVIYVSLQTFWLWTLRVSLWSFGLSSEVQPSSDISGPE